MVESARTIGVAVMDLGSAASLTRTRVEGTLRPRSAAFAIGLYASDDATYVLRESELRATEGPGLYGYGGAEGEVVDSVVADNRFAGVMFLSGRLRIEGTTIEGSLPDDGIGGGFGVYAASNFIVFGGFILDVVDSTIGPHPYAAMWAYGPGSYRLSGNELYGSEGVPLGNWQAHGNAVYAWGGVQPWDGTSGLLLEGNTFVDAEAVAVLLNGAGATLDGNVFQGSAREVHQQRCEGVPRVPSPAAGWEICDGGALLTDDSMLFDTLYVPEVALAE